MSEDKLQYIIDLLKSINSKLAVKKIIQTLKEEDAVENTLKVEEKETEEIIMDLKDITIMVETEKAILVVKKGYQKWIPKSLIGEPTDFVEGFYGHIILRAKKEGEKTAPEDWFPNKPWDKYEVKKR